MTRWEFTRLLWLAWKMYMWGTSEDRKQMAGAMVQEAERLSCRIDVRIAEIEAGIAARKHRRASE